MSSIFQEVREKVSLEDFARDNGFAPNRAGYCSCPLHTDNTPSMRIVSSEQRWRCYSCNRYGDITDLASLMWNCSKYEAVRKLDQQYHLGMVFKGRAPEAKKPREAIIFDLKGWWRETDDLIAWTIDNLWQTVEAGKRVEADESLISALEEEIAFLESLHDEMLRCSPADGFKQYHETRRRLEHGQELHRQANREWFEERPF